MPGGCQVLMFSATFPEPIRKFAKTFAPSPHEITLKKEELPLSGVHQFYVVVDDVKKKHELALQMQDLTTGGSTIIFCNVSLSLHTTLIFCNCILIPLFIFFRDAPTQINCPKH